MLEAKEFPEPPKENAAQVINGPVVNAARGFPRIARRPINGHAQGNRVPRTTEGKCGTGHKRRCCQLGAVLVCEDFPELRGARLTAMLEAIEFPEPPKENAAQVINGVVVNSARCSFAKTSQNCAAPD